MAREGISSTLETPAIRHGRRASVAIVFNVIFAIGLAFFWLILRDFGPSSQDGIGDYAVWVLASIAHLWYYSPERWPFKAVVACVSLAVNAAMLTSIARMVAGY